MAGFVKVLYEVGQYARWAEFARESSVHSVSLSKWKNAESCPDGYNLLRLIQAATRRAGGSLEALAEGVPAAKASVQVVADLEHRLEQLEGTVSAQGEAQTKALKALTAGIRRLERPRESEAQLARRKDER